MIGRLMRGGVTLAIYVTLATLIAQAALVMFLGMKYGVNRTKFVQMMAILQDVDLFAMKDAADGQNDDLPTEQASYAQILEERSKKGHDLQLREQAVRNLQNLVRNDLRKLSEERKRFKQIRTGFDTLLTEKLDKAVSEGMDDVRAKLEAIKAPQAKDLLRAMLDPDDDNYAIDDVVTLLKGMPTTKSAKIIAEFNTKEEMEEIGEVLRLIREGEPIADLAATARNELEPPAAEPIP